MPIPRSTAPLTALGVLLVLAPPLAGQTPPATPGMRPNAGEAVVYRREVFDYSRGGRPDPFRPLIGKSDAGTKLSDLTLRGVVYHPERSRSVAVLSRAGIARPVRARVGDNVGGVRIVAIHPRSIDVLYEEFGVARRETLEIKKAAPKGSQS